MRAASADLATTSAAAALGDVCAADEDEINGRSLVKMYLLFFLVFKRYT